MNNARLKRTRKNLVKKRRPIKGASNAVKFRVIVDPSSLIQFQKLVPRIFVIGWRCHIYK